MRCLLPSLERTPSLPPCSEAALFSPGTCAAYAQRSKHDELPQTHHCHFLIHAVFEGSSRRAYHPFVGTRPPLRGNFRFASQLQLEWVVKTAPAHLLREIRRWRDRDAFPLTTRGR